MSRMGEWLSRSNDPGRANLAVGGPFTGAFEANNSKVEVSEPTKMRGDKPLKVEKARAAPPKVKPPVAKALVVTEVVQEDQNMVQEAGDEPHKILSEPRVEED
ncbi:unnamed protein product [Prunus armeniaca]|uniref:Uncharacterized protein n=1 Tax=Prunus armeniaca TaxID=36596 RepID=A0A6J5V222_PRUAR|nr:unnamed protein product [Prunus armeniaca]